MPIRRAPRIDVMPAFRYYQQALVCRDRNQVARAQALLRLSLQHDTKFFPSLGELAAIHEEKNEFAKAEGLLRRSLHIYEDNVEALIQYAGLLFKLRRPLQAFQFLRRAEHLDPDRPEAFYFRYCAYFYNAGKPRQALRALAVLHSAHPDYYPACLTIAELQLYLDRPWLAALWYRRALAIDPDCREALLSLSALCGNEFGDRERALSYCRRLLELDPTDALARTNYAIAKNLPPRVDRRRSLASIWGNLESVPPAEGRPVLRLFESLRPQFT